MVFGNCRGKTIEMGWWSWCMNVCSWRFSPDFWPEIKKKATISSALAYHSSNFGNFLSINAVKHLHSRDGLILPTWDRTCFILTDLGASSLIWEAAWPCGQGVGLAIRRSRVRVPLWPLAGFVLGRPEFKFSATLVNSQLVAFCQLGFLILLCCIWIICF